MQSPGRTAIRQGDKAGKSTPRSWTSIHTGQRRQRTGYLKSRKLERAAIAKCRVGPKPIASGIKHEQKRKHRQRLARVSELFGVSFDLSLVLIEGGNEKKNKLLRHCCSPTFKNIPTTTAYGWCKTRANKPRSSSSWTS